MRLYLDSAVDADWADLLPTGLFHGITTNPTLAARAGLDYPRIDWGAMARRAVSLGARELHAQVYGDAATYLDFAHRLYDAGDAAGIATVVKIPLTEAGIRATPAIAALKRPILMTACYHAKQMIAAQTLGATYIAPYVGRMRDAGLDAPAHLRRMVEIAGAADRPTCILAASIRSVDEVLEIVGCGVRTLTISATVAHALIDEPLTTAASEAFENSIANGPG